eukprot:TRINITY_DN12625_c0_g1_i1.p1 TRINITY_DN12625_c0_g1~~TRINITY_DN12625_c0_g1_i1.p1  ORF type:complete len:197 (+),score=66.82 TRINITY_DN12625_c0_g1_i1:70-660(+)
MCIRDRLKASNKDKEEMINYLDLAKRKQEEEYDAIIGSLKKELTKQEADINEQMKVQGELKKNEDKLKNEIEAVRAMANTLKGNLMQKKKKIHKLKVKLKETEKELESNIKKLEDNIKLNKENEASLQHRLKMLQEKADALERELGDSEEEVKTLKAINVSLEEVKTQYHKLLQNAIEDAKPVSYTHLTLPTICSV